LKEPPESVQNMLKIVYFIMKDGADVKGTSATVKEWQVIMKFMKNSEFQKNFKQILSKPMMNFKKIAEKVKPLVESTNKDDVKKASAAAGVMCDAVLKLATWCITRAEA